MSRGVSWTEQQIGTDPKTAENENETGRNWIERLIKTEEAEQYLKLKNDEQTQQKSIAYEKAAERTDWRLPVYIYI